MRSEMSLTLAMISPTAWVFSLRATMFSATISACSRMASMARAVSSTACKPGHAGLRRGLGRGDDLLRALADLGARMGDLVHGGGGFLNGGKLLFDAGRLLLGGGADLGRGGVQVLGGLAALAGKLPQALDHAVERSAEMSDLVLADRGHLAAQLSAPDPLDEFHEGIERLRDGSAQRVGDEEAQEGGACEGEDDRGAALLLDLTDASLAEGDGFALDLVDFLEQGVPGIATGVQGAIVATTPGRSLF